MPNSVSVISPFFCVLAFCHFDTAAQPVLSTHPYSQAFFCLTPRDSGGRAATFSQTSYATVYCRLRESVDAPARPI